MQLMKIRTNKLFVSVLFMMIFLAKMIISIAPAFLSFNNKTVNAVIMQLEQESKNEKEDPEKDASKDKKFFDEDCQYVHHAVLVPLAIQTPNLLSHPHALYQPGHHLSVPTPPPDTLRA